MSALNPWEEATKVETEAKEKYPALLKAVRYELAAGEDGTEVPINAHRVKTSSGLREIPDLIAVLAVTTTLSLSEVRTKADKSEESIDPTSCVWAPS